jgi:23S rRNA pseudouridine2605 synthase
MPPRAQAAGRPAVARPAPEKTLLGDGERIAKLLARAGIASRREVERMIAEGAREAGRSGDHHACHAAHHAERHHGGRQAREGPRGRAALCLPQAQRLITAERDPAGRPTIYTALRNALPRHAAADADRAARSQHRRLLLLTNDGELKRAMELPATGIPRTYRARTLATSRRTALRN